MKKHLSCPRCNSEVGWQVEYSTDLGTIILRCINCEKKLELDAGVDQIIVFDRETIMYAVEKKVAYFYKETGETPKWLILSQDNYDKLKAVISEKGGFNVRDKHYVDFYRGMKVCVLANESQKHFIEVA